MKSLQTNLLKWWVVFLMAVFLGLAPTHAQMSDQQRAQAYYFEAEAALADGQLKTADDLRAKAEELLGSDNSKLLFLETRIHYANGTYEAAQRAMQRFYDFNPGPNLKRDMAPYVVKIEAKLEEARLAKVAAEKARLVAEVRRRERPARLARTVAACLTSESCERAIAALEKEENDEGIAALVFELRHKQCAEFNDNLAAKACTLVFVQPQIGVPEAMRAVERACSLGHLVACNTAAALLLPRKNGIDRIRTEIPVDIDRAVTLYKANCARNEYYSCSILSFLYSENTFGVKKNGSEFKKFTRRACVATAINKENYLNLMIKRRCEKWGFPARAQGMKGKYDLFIASR